MPLTQIPEGQSKGLLHGLPPPDDELDVAADDALDVEPDDALDVELDDEVDEVDALDEAAPPPEEADIPEELWLAEVAPGAPAPPLPLDVEPEGNRFGLLEHAPAAATAAEKANRASHVCSRIDAMNQISHTADEHERGLSILRWIRYERNCSR